MTRTLRDRTRTAPAVRLAVPFAVLGLLLGASACATGQAAPAAPGAAAPADPDRIEPLPDIPVPRLPVTVPSADGRQVTVASAERIIPLNGSLAELVFSLGLGGRAVARDVSTTFEQAAKLPVITQAHEVSAEGVLSLRPTVVLADRSTGPAEAVEQIRAAGVPLIVLDDPKELADIDTRIDAVATALGVPDAGARLKERTRTRIDEVRAHLPATGATRPKVAFLYLRGSASVFLLGGPDSGAPSLIEAAGGEDAGTAAHLTGDFTPLTSEALVKAAPDAILVMRKGLDSVGGVDGMLKLPGVAQTPAGLDRRIVSIDDGRLLSYGPRTPQVLRDLATQLHRDAK
ncbi:MULTISPECIES: ABC transporter substrate-binding protein [Kitasatospora]|uniref:Putative hemin ABC transporter substrate-binding protein n=1 Tax=Kitasatospora setae (strain ATCC 33774 / DSM 43861 / JCM 3304 / KCC A-0304 / NBRC 14216 / KM-6054) TaxID=452652 RepID=E4NJH5_KITSK|nr:MULTISPECIES: ABC transporter substrate-binding protein [Kitasatospora]BAJ33123.1 putative hemin ABC transporter substrate-binding protein [Kitasatospora setae KM-6054]